METILPPPTGGEVGLSDEYLVLDSYQAVSSLSDPGAGRYVFQVGAEPAGGAEVVTATDILHDLSEFQVLSFRMPLPPVIAPLANAVHGAGGLPVLTPVDADTGDEMSHAMSQMPFGSRVTMQVSEFASQSTAGRLNTRYHFEFDVALDQSPPDQTGIILFPIQGGEKYVFTKLFNEIQRLTVQFRSPDYNMSFPADRIAGATARVAAGAQVLELASPSALIGASVTNLTRVMVEGFRSASAVVDRWVNRPEGHLVVGVTAPAGGAPGYFQLEPLVDTAVYGLALGATIPTTGQIRVLIPKNRVRIPVRLRRILPQRTNTIVPV